MSNYKSCGLKRYHLMNCHFVESTWQIIDLENNSIGAASGERLSWLGYEDIYQGDTLTELLLNIYDAKDERFYVVHDAMMYEGMWRYEKYPLHKELGMVIGYCREFYTRKAPGEWNYGYSFPGELWVREKGIGYYDWKETITKVEGFNMREEKKPEIEHYLETVKKGQKEEAEE